METTSGGDEDDNPRFCICMIDEINNNDEENSKWILCVSCKNWYHTICALMSDEEHETIVKSNEKWFCETYQCQQSKLQLEQQQIMTSQKHEKMLVCYHYPPDKRSKLYKGIKGLKIHCSKSHKEHSSDSQNDVNELSQEIPDTSNNEHSISPDSLNVVCEICNKLCKNERGLMMHKKKKHKAPEQIKCEICGEICKNKKSFNAHTRIRHKQVYRSDIVKDFITEIAPLSSNAENGCKENTQNPKEIHQNKIDELKSEFCSILNEFDENKFHKKYIEFEKIAQEAITALPGPRHPAQKYYEARKNKKLFTVSKRDYKSSTNPERADKRGKEKSKQKYNYELSQYLYTNKRKSLVNKFLNSDSKQCTIDSNTIHESFTERCSNENNAEWDYYEMIDDNEQRLLDVEYEIEIEESEVLEAIKRVRMDNAAGPDDIIPRALKTFNFNKILAVIFTIISFFNNVPPSFRRARTILTDKGGDLFSPANWRPISICSLIRRIYEGILDRRLRRYLRVNDHQRGFTSQPGVHINIALLESVLQKAKAMKMTCYIVFLDIKQAFDQIGHKHMIKTLHEARIPTALRNIIINLIEGNYTQIRTKNCTTKPISFMKGILQGGPLSPTLFIMAINRILDIITDPDIAAEHGFKLCEELENLIVACFADDTALIANSLASAIFLTELTIKLLQQIGLEVNLKKCFAISIVNGEKIEERIPICGSFIDSIGINDKIKYLGATFKDTINLDKDDLITKFSRKLEVLTGSSLLHPNQKLNILNSYLWPTLTFKLQFTPLKQLSKSFLKNLDKILKSCVKEFIGLPEDIPNAMIYSPRKYKGLGLINAGWEAPLQHINIMACLHNSKNPYLTAKLNFKEEITTALKQLNITDGFDIDELMKKRRPANAIRNHLRYQQFNQWCDPEHYPYKHKGVETFALNTYTNKWIYDGYGLSTSTWTTAIKMIGQIAAVRGVPGRSKDGRQCRFCTETYTFESLSHVLGSCPRGELLRTKRHNLVRSAFADELRKKPYKIYEEKECIAEDGTTRRIDIIAINESTKTAIVLDPTIRFETSNQQDEEVNLEKRKIYEPCINDLKRMYGVNHIQVFGLLFGARGTIFNTYEKIRKDLSLPKSLTEKIVKIILNWSVKILNYHIHTLD